MVVSNKIKNVFLEVRACRANSMNFVLPDHLRERKSQFRGAHCAAHRQEHFAAAPKMRHVRFRGVNNDGRIKVSVVVLDEIPYAHVRLSLRNILRSKSLPKSYATRVHDSSGER
jgi:hypothetical protein